MKVSELRQMTDEELRQELANQRKELYNLRHQSVTEQLENPAQLGKCRKGIAQILTVLREREQQAAQGPAPAQEVEAKQ